MSVRGSKGTERAGRLMSVEGPKRKRLPLFCAASAMLTSIPISLAGSIPIQTDASFSANSIVLSMAEAVLAGTASVKEAVANERK